MTETVIFIIYKILLILKAGVYAACIYLLWQTISAIIEIRIYAKRLCKALETIAEGYRPLTDNTLEKTKED